LIYGGIMNRLMSFEEEVAITTQAARLYGEGKKAEAHALLITTPIPPWLAKVVKEKWGAAQWLKNSGWNLAEVEAEFGPNWLDN
jgi:hypothetical protein